MLRVPAWITALLIAAGVAESAVSIVCLTDASPQTFGRATTVAAAVPSEPEPAPPTAVNDSRFVERRRRDVSVCRSPRPAPPAPDTDRSMACDSLILDATPPPVGIHPSTKGPR